jgi:predicted peroxiredoxin
MKKLIIACAIAVAGLLGPFSQAGEAPKDGVFIHVSHGADDPHRLLMALQMANIMAEEHPVLVYFDIRAVDAVLADSPEVGYSHFASSRQQLQSLQDKGALLMACPGCLKAAGRSPDELAEGVLPADKAKFFSFTDGRILSLDY